MMKSVIGGRWLDSFKRFSNIWLIFWRWVANFLPESFTTRWIFFWKDIGYGLPSSRFLIARILSHVDWDGANVIVELGGGKGAMTRAILRSKKPENYLTSCEIEEDRYNLLRALADEGDLNVMFADAAKCLDTFTDSSIDLIISTLPLGSMPRVHAREILETGARALKPGGFYIQYQYFATNKHDIEEFFTITRVDWEPINFPPAFIYICEKK